MFNFFKKLKKRKKLNEKYINNMFSKARRSKLMNKYEVVQHLGNYVIIKFENGERIIISKHLELLEAKKQFVKIYKNLKGEYKC